MKKNIFIALLSLFLWGCAIQDNLKLSELAKKDRLDRKQNNPETFKNDIERIAEVKAILENDVLKTSNDYFNAAIVLQHSDKPEDYKIANKLATKAVELNPGNKEAKLLIAQSMDRYLLSINRPQIYGTQRLTLGDLEYLCPIDTLSISDKQRKQLGVSTLKEKLNYFNEIHKKRITIFLHTYPQTRFIESTILKKELT